jgi:hypothetical protein
MSIGKTPCPLCHGPKHRGSAVCRKCLDSVREVPQAKVTPVPVDSAKQVIVDRDKQRLSSELTTVKAKYKDALQTIERQDQELRVVGALDQSLDTLKIQARTGSGTSEGTAILVASDWHIEETVGAEVGGLNRFDPTIAKKRVEKFFQAGLRLIKLLQQDITIHTAVLALLGDFISNDIHEEFADLTNESPMHAIVTAQNYLISGIEFLLEHSTLNLVIPCHSGNHARTTKTTRFSAESGHSLEYLLYLHIAAHFRTEPRVSFIIPESYHSYLDIYGQTIRFHHGHAIKYGGGIGGIFIPTYKAISQWDKARRADLDVFGHFHQMKDGGNFLCNGSLIGYNGFALAMKCDYEPPRQTLFLLDKRRGRTCTWPILLN